MYAKKKFQFYCRFSLENGYRHIDCAKVYLNEKEVGKVFDDYIGKTIPREELFIIGKVCLCDSIALFLSSFFKISRKKSWRVSSKNFGMVNP